MDELLDAVNDLVKGFIDESMNVTTAEKAGLDRRAGYNLFVNEDAIAVHVSNAGSLNYYGGFEYVSKENVKTLGDYVFYSAEDDRVQEHIDFFYSKSKWESND